MTNATVFTRRLEGVNYNIAIFASPDVQAATNRYFASYQEILDVLSTDLASAQSDELLRAASAAFEQEAVAAARMAVLTAMEQDLGEDLE